LDAPTALELKRDSNLRLAFSGAIGIHFLDFFDQWDPKSPWADKRVRLAAIEAVDLRSRNEAENLGASRLTGSLVPRKFEFALSLEPYPDDPAKAKKLLVEAGYPNGFDAGDLYPYPPYFSMGEAVGTNLTAVGIKTRMVTMERAAFQSAWLSKKLKGICVCIHAVYGNAASRMAEFVPSDGSFARGADPDLDGPARAAGELELPLALGLEAPVAQPLAPGLDRLADRVQIERIAAQLAGASHHVGRRPYEGAERGAGLDGVLAPRPRGRERG